MGGCSARRASARTSSATNSSRFLRRISTTSVAVQAHRPINTSSIGPGAVLLSRLESITIAWPLEALPTKRSPSVQFTEAVTVLAIITFDYRCWAQDELKHETPAERPV